MMVGRFSRNDEAFRFSLLWSVIQIGVVLTGDLPGILNESSMREIFAFDVRKDQGLPEGRAVSIFCKMKKIFIANQEGLFSTLSTAVSFPIS